jgi:hypothetical protein
MQSEMQIEAEGWEPKGLHGLQRGKLTIDVLDVDDDGEALLVDWPAYDPFGLLEPKRYVFRTLKEAVAFGNELRA